MNEPTAVKPNWIPLKSSMLEAAAYNDEKWVLSIRFKSGLELAYQEVPPEVNDEFLSAPSQGKYYNANIKGKYEAVGEPEAESTRGQAVEKTETNDLYRVTANGTATKIAEGVSIKGGFVDTTPVDDGHALQTTPVTTFDKSDIPEDDPTIPREEAAIVRETAGEVLGALEPPKTPQEALALLSEQSGIIQATIAQSKELAVEGLKVRVTDAPSYSDAGEKMKVLVAVKERAANFLDPIRAILYQPYKLAGENLKSATDPLDSSIAFIKRQRLTWSQEQERLEAAGKARLQREAEEQARRDQEARSQQLTLEAVEQAVSEGDEQAAEKLLEEPIQAAPVYVPPVRVASAVPVEQGISKRKSWKAMLKEPDGMDDLILDIAEGIKSRRANKGLAGHAPITFVKLNETAVNQSAKAQEKAFSYPGLMAYNDETEAVRKTKH